MRTRRYCRRFRRREDPCWIDCMSMWSMLQYAACYRPVVGFNFWLERATNG